MPLEGIPEKDIQHVEYTRDVFAIKMSIQRGVMQVFLGNTSSTESKDEWINSYSSKFRNLFEQKMVDQTFLERAKTNLEATVDEFVAELRKVE
jgi:putative heme degradation protein